VLGLRQLLFLFVSMWNVVSAQGGASRISGTITDSTGRAIQFANVRALPKGNRVVAGEDGRFVLVVEPSVRPSRSAASVSSRR
jgi:hypothetical protein